MLNTFKEFNDCSNYKIAHQIDESNTYAISRGDTFEIAEEIGHDIGKRLLFLEEFIRIVVRTGTPPFIIKAAPDGLQRIQFTQIASIFFKRLNKYLQLYSPALHYSETVEAFFSVCKELSAFDNHYDSPDAICSNMMTAAELFNALVEKLRECVSSERFKKKVRRRRERTRRQYASLSGYTDALFEHRRSRLIVIRIDLKYTEDNKALMGSRQSKRDLKHLLNNMRSKPSLFGDLEGYIWKLECGLEGAHHFHCIFFFNNDHHQRDDYMGELIGKYWVEVVTKGRGAYFNCNRLDYKAKQKRLGIGRIEAYDQEKRSNLLRVLAYLCKSEQHIRARASRKFKTIDRGQMPPLRDKKLGRPRTTGSPVRAGE